MSVFEIYIEKKTSFAEEAAAVAADLKAALQITSIERLRIINRYFTEGVSSEVFEKSGTAIFSDPPADIVYDKLPSFDGARFFALEYLPGQFDQRADSCAQSISLAAGIERPKVQTAKIFVFYGNISDDEWKQIKSWLINPVECREAALEKPETLFQKYKEPDDISIIDGFISLSGDDLEELRQNMNLAMDLSDLQFCQAYFRDEEKREPSITEIRVLDTYWSDHCRHTTFLTELDNVKIDSSQIKESYEKYLELKQSLGSAGKPVTLMDIATIGAKVLKKRGLLDDLDESEEINACSVKIKVDKNGKHEDWLLMFKNETHNHPTEIEPFGGASTCLGGAIRDPLSGRSFVYQAMRLTGAGDPLQSAADTLPGKLPQRKICRTAASGYSSYGNQIGLTTGHVREIYHSGYTAKRMELGAVIAAAPAANVVRQTPQPGDVVILLGGRTGRDGIGGATSSSKSHTSSSLETCGAEVQKGDALEERKMQRLFRNPEATRLIKKCNDFGAGGVSVSVGELADGLEIDLNKVSKKYEGLDGTELAISESQERMSVVVAQKDVDAFIAFASGENLEAAVIAKVTGTKRLIMKWREKTIVNLSREFLNSNGAKKHAKVHITDTNNHVSYENVLDLLQLEKLTGSLNICSQKGLIDRFDSSIGTATVIAPLGGKFQLTPAQSMTAKIPVLDGETNTCSVMSWGFDPEISSVSPYHGAVFAVVYSVAKIIAAGGSRKKCWLSFQEYFEKLRDDPVRWGKPAAALLGALDAQLGLETAAIGGKDSMSGSFEDIDVPPALVSFAVSVSKTDLITSPEFKKAGSYVYHLKSPFFVFDKCDFSLLREFFDSVEKLIAQKKVLSCWAIGNGGTAEAVVKMCVGNRIGLVSEKKLASGGGFGGFLIETDSPLTDSVELFGRTTNEYTLKTEDFEASLEKLQKIWEQTLEPVYPSFAEQKGKTENFTFNQQPLNTNKSITAKPKHRNANPRFVIPVCPGTNNEYDAAKAIEKARGQAEIFIIRNLTPADIAQSITAFEKTVRSAQGIVIPGGYSGGDDSDGSGKFITAFFRNSSISDAVMELLQKRDGLICGIGSGFHSLIKLGLVPYGEIRSRNESSPALAFNTIARHQSTFVKTRVVSNKSPWLSCFKTGDIFTVPVSNSEGRFAAEETLIRELAANGQIATQYVDFDGSASQDIRFNPSNSDFAVEGVTSPDGRIFGRMAHNERVDDGLFKNIPDIRKMDIFRGAVEYFS